MSVRWQYQVIDVGVFDTGQRLTNALAQLGAAGWELVQVVDKSSNWLAGLERGIAIFRRPVPDGEEPGGPWAELVRRDGTRRPPSDPGAGAEGWM
jgi:hypothetical protein